MQINLDVVKKYNKLSTKYNKYSTKYPSIKYNLQPETLIVFKLYHNKTPNELTQKLFHRTNSLPIRNLQTRIVLGDNEDGKIDCTECLVFYYFSGCVAPKIEILNVLYVYRKGLDKEFESITYLNTYTVDCNEIKRLSFEQSRFMVNVLKDFTN